jgi:hypothetical protein
MFKQLVTAAVLASCTIGATGAMAAIDTEQDMMTGQSKHFLILHSTNTVSNSIGHHETAALVVRCKPGAMNMYLATPTFNGLRNTNVAVRWNQGSIERQYWGSGTSGKAFFTKTPLKFLEKAATKNELILGWEPYGKTLVAARFDLSAHRADLKQMIKLCK